MLFLAAPAIAQDLKPLSLQTFLMLDADKDGIVTRPEYLAYLDRRFKGFDNDDSGTFTREDSLVTRR